MDKKSQPVHLTITDEQIKANRMSCLGLFVMFVLACIVLNWLLTR